MTRTILIGKGRRITLEELRSACFDTDVKLEFVQINPPEKSVDTSPSRLVFSSSALLSSQATKAALILLSLTLSQGRISNDYEEVVGRLVDLVNGISDDEFRMPMDPRLFVEGLVSLIGTAPSVLLENGVERPFLARLISLARIALSLSNARSLSSKSVSDAIASLSFERLSNRNDTSSTMSMDSFSSIVFDELRPHRGCIESAAVMRACLQGSTVRGVGSCQNGSTENNNGIATQLDKLAAKYTMTTPQYHGPAREAILATCKTIELELNCSESFSMSSGDCGGEAYWDDTVAVLAVQSATNGVDALLTGSMMRAGLGGDLSLRTRCSDSLCDAASGLETAVISLQASLEKEAELGCRFVLEALSKNELELKAKDAEKAKRAAERDGGEGVSNVAISNDDEFAGMTEAQKSKILKKRAEKEAKAESKRKAKEAKASGGEAALTSLFGAGTALVYPLMTSSSTGTGDSSSISINLSEKTILAQLEKCMETLLSGGLQRKPKVPKGTRDYLPEQMSIRDEAFFIIRRVFKRHGAVEIDTPVFELKETLTGKYGEDSKLIYDLADQGGELLALRYDLTVPFARFLAVNSVGNIKRFHIGKVYRRDQPALSRGRYREFYQCDFDIAGVYGRMVPDSECLAVACEILDALPIGDFGIKLNHRRLLDAILDLCGVPADKFRTICSAVDKLDKEPWNEVRREMVEDKGLTGDVADKIGEFVVLKGDPWDMYNSLMDAKKFGDHKGAMEAMEDMRILFEYLDAMDKLKFISFDLSLARGLDYYTGVIYEAVCMNGNTQVGSIGGGGRYDNLVSMFQEAGKVTPCVGVSVGIERVFTLMEERLREQQGGSIKLPNVSVLVASAGGESQLHHRMKLANLLWSSNISAEFNQQENPKLKFEIANALERDIPFMVIVGEEEAKENKCKVKDLRARTEETVEVDDLVGVLREKGVVPVGCEFAVDLLNGEKSKSSSN